MTIFGHLVYYIPINFPHHDTLMGLAKKYHILYSDLNCDHHAGMTMSPLAYVMETHEVASSIPYTCMIEMCKNTLYLTRRPTK